MPRALKKEGTYLVLWGFLVLLTLLALFPTLVTDLDPGAVVLKEKELPPSPGHLLGTDKLGHDNMSRLLYGARISLAIGLLAPALSLMFGFVIGGLGGYLGGWFDGLVGRLVDILLSFPSIMLAIALSLALKGIDETGFTGILLAVALASWAGFARVSRSLVLSLKERDFIAAARSIGAPTSRILLKHLMPNCIAPLIVLYSMSISAAIMTESSLSFLGIGMQQGVPTWGGMVRVGWTEYQDFGLMWGFAGSAAALFMTVLALNLIGDRVRDKLDPRLKGTPGL